MKIEQDSSLSLNDLKGALLINEHGDALVMCQARGWQSFKSDWVVDKQKSFATTSYGEGEQEI